MALYRTKAAMELGVSCDSNDAEETSDILEKAMRNDAHGPK